jgi:SAM-dependent methyltransferase
MTHTATRRTNCRFCGAPLTHSVVDLGAQPPCSSFLHADRFHDPEPIFPLHAKVCAQCLLVQLDTDVAPDSIYSEYAYFSSYSVLWLAHAKQYVDMIVPKLGLDASSTVVELASNDGYLLRNFVARGINAYGIDPAANVAEAAIKNGIPTVVEFFGVETARRLVAEGKQADLILGNNVFGHIPDINDFVGGMKLLLKRGGTITIEIPHFMRLVENNQFDTIYHEHYCYHTLLTDRKIFARHGLRLFDVEELPTHGGSVRMYACHDDDLRPVSAAVETLIAEERRRGFDALPAYTAFGERVKETKRKLLTFLIEARRAGKVVVGYGAPGKGNTLLNYCGIREDFVDYVVDRNPYKHGRFLPGSRIPIYAPDRVADTKPDYVLILPWNIKDEIIKQMAHIRDWGGRFVVPIPKTVVV